MGGGGCTNFPLWFDINIPPVGNVFVSLYLLISTYSTFQLLTRISKLLLDIKIAVSRIGIFAVIYALIPFAIGAKLMGFGLWLVPTGAGFLLAIIGMPLFAYFRRKAENHILKEERQMQTVLSETSDNLTSLQEFPKLLTVMIDTLRKTLNINHIAVYLLNKENNDEYLLKKSYPRFSKTKFIKANDSFITQLKKDNDILVRDEIKIELELMINDIQLKNILSEMIELSAEGVIPCVLDNQLLGFIILCVFQ